MDLLTFFKNTFFTFMNQVLLSWIIFSYPTYHSTNAIWSLLMHNNGFRNWIHHQYIRTFPIFFCMYDSMIVREIRMYTRMIWRTQENFVLPLNTRIIFWPWYLLNRYLDVKKYFLQFFEIVSDSIRIENHIQFRMDRFMYYLVLCIILVLRQH